jgi:hypothetical protein
VVLSLFFVWLYIILPGHHLCAKNNVSQCLFPQFQNYCFSAEPSEAVMMNSESENMIRWGTLLSVLHVILPKILNLSLKFVKENIQMEKHYEFIGISKTNLKCLREQGFRLSDCPRPRPVYCNSTWRDNLSFLL